MVTVPELSAGFVPALGAGAVPGLDVETVPELDPEPAAELFPVFVALAPPPTGTTVPFHEYPVY